MSRTLDELQSEMLRLPAEARARLASPLLESLEEEPDRLEHEIEEMWAKEAEQRLRRYEAGEATAIPVHEVLADIRQRLRDNRTP